MNGNSTQNQKPAQHRWSLLLASLGLLLTFFITTIQLDRDSLALDEAWTMWTVRGDSLADTLRRVNSDVHPPLYFVLVDGWIVLAGESVFAVRIFSVLMVLIALAATYAAGKRLFDSETGLIALLYLSTAGFVVYYAREARMYPLLMAFSSLSAWAYLRWRAQGNRTNTALYAALLAGLIYTHYQGVWIALAHGLHALLTRRWRWLGVLVLLVLLFLPWFPTLIEQEQDHPALPIGVRPTTWGEIRSLVYLLTDRYWPLLAGAFLLSRAPSRLVRDEKETALFLMLWVILPPLMILALNTWVRPSYQPRYTITILPAIALGVAYALRHLRWRGLAYALLAGLMIAHLLVYTDLWPNPAPWQAVEP